MAGAALMFRLRAARLLAGIPVVLAAATHAAPTPAPVVAEAQLRVLNHRAIDALARPDREFLDAVTAQDFLLTDSGGHWIGRRHHIERPDMPWVRDGVAYDDVKVRLFWPLALVHGILQSADGDRRPVRVRYTDVYRWDGSRWLRINAQHTPLRAGIEPRLQPGKAPAHSPWRGTDPTGDDLAVLRELNAQYVRAFREADVAWYDAHLAPDYVVVNNDGSFHDRARALAGFAEPVFATYMQSFPVDRVRIRVFGDIALIHAENAYERKDRRRDVNRYTDIWQKRPDGRWQCIAAHITTHKSPA